jgi:endogenous inhibitor of DNA gyrase (YacG/DUF329 family)
MRSSIVLPLERRCAFWVKLLAMKHRCPICKTATDSDLHKDFPFCGERCRLLDLGAWASETYVVSDPVFDEAELEESGSETDARRKRNDTVN